MTTPRRRVSQLEARDLPLMVLGSMLFFALVLWSVFRERDVEWEPIQSEFVELLEIHGQKEAAQSFTPGIKQIWIPALGKVDRCTTCHLGYEWGSALPADIEAPLAPHPDPGFMRSHPFPEFGCTTCHGGQGFATEARAAHGDVEFWDEPVLSRDLAAENGVTQADLLQIRCNGCHRRQDAVPGLETIAKAKKLFKKKKCLVCHVVAGKGGLVAPELTDIGDKNPELFDFTHVTGHETVFNWHAQHLISAETVSPGTTMPTYGLAPDEANALTILLLSWRRADFPPRYLPGGIKDLGAETVKPILQPAVPPVIGGADAGRRVFVSKGCNTCHTVGGGPLLGPDLAGVGEKRDEHWLRTWLADPAGMIRSHPDLLGWPAEYGNVVMPNQNLSTAEIDALVGYLALL